MIQIFIYKKKYNHVIMNNNTIAIIILIIIIGYLLLNISDKKKIDMATFDPAKVNPASL